MKAAFVPSSPAALLAIASVVTILCGVIALTVGQESISLLEVWRALTRPDPHNMDHAVVQTSRLARVVVAVLVGASLAVAGGLMQALTLNPLASPGLFGINAGAMFAVVLIAPVIGVVSFSHFMLLAFLGAGATGALVYAVGMRGPARPDQARLVLAGAAISSLLFSFTQAALVINQDGLDSILFWLAGSTAGRGMNEVRLAWPPIVLGLLGSAALARHLNILVAGEAIARGLGQNVGRLRLLLSVCVILLAGTAVSLAGTVGFVGLVVPHIVRRLFPNDFRWLLPGYALFGALLLLLADLLGRIALPPEEIPVGAMTALIGAPYFIYLTRRSGQHA